MIRVTIDLIPFGDERRKETLNVVEISNLETLELKADDRRCKYKITLDGGKPKFRTHWRGRGVLALVRKAL